MPIIIAGRVLNNDRRPVDKVAVSLKGKKVTETKSDGSFAVRLLKPEPRVALTFSANGYVVNTRVYDATRAVAGSTVIIWPVAYSVSFDPTRELDIAFARSRVRVSANSLTAGSGKLVRDTVELQFTLFDITNPFQRAAASGDFTGRLADGSVRRLNSYGIFDLNVHDSQGRTLSLRKDSEIQLSIPVPRQLVKRAPRQVGFFDFDKMSGMWVHAGMFELVPSTLTYNGTVKRFGGSQNLDEPQDTTCVTVQIVSWFDGSGLPNMLVNVQGSQYVSSGTTDANGFVCLLVERNATFSVMAQGTPDGGSTFWGTPNPTTLMSPNISSTAVNCGDPVQCPFVGTAIADMVVGLPERSLL